MITINTDKHIKIIPVFFFELDVVDASTFDITASVTV
jgi:hypothetical protein